MKYNNRSIILSLTTAIIFLASCRTEFSGNPVFPGWYADPEGIIYGSEYWIYPTYSDHYGDIDSSAFISEEQKKIRQNCHYEPFLMQTFLDAFSSPDLVHWTKHSHVLDIRDVKWAGFAVWAPSVISANDQYYLFFGANDIRNDEEPGGIGVATADNPAGPFKDALGKALIGEIHNGAQPIDQYVFRDDDGEYYMYYGGWGHCNVVRLNSNLLSLQAFDDGQLYREVTPEGYVEGPFMLKRKGKYYFMWSEGGWTGPDYRVAYAISDSPFGPFERIGVILQQDENVARGAGHHSVISIPGKDEHYIVYHRRPLDTDNGNHRETCIEVLEFDENGYIIPVKLSEKGVKKRKLGRSEITA